MNRLSIWAMGLLGGAVSLLAVAAESLPSDHVFAPSSFWYRPLPTDAPLHPDSAAFVAEFLRQKSAYYGTVNINTTDYASPVYLADDHTPTVTVTEWNCQGKRYKDEGLAWQWARVPVPAHAMPAKGTDAEMTIYDPAADTLWDFWNVRRDEKGAWQACWGGRLERASQSDGIYPGHYGATATGLPFIGGQVTAEELQRGEIRHVIGITLVDLADAGVFSWPARRSDGFNPGRLPHRIPEGLRFRLDPTINVEALKLHPVGKIIARAAQKYGFVVWDKAGGISIRAQNPLSYTRLGQPNPYQALFGKTPAYAVLEGFPWNRLQFLPMDYGKPE